MNIKNRKLRDRAIKQTKRLNRKRTYEIIMAEKPENKDGWGKPAVKEKSK